MTINEPRQNSLPVYPHHGETYTSYIREERTPLGANYTAVFEYADCIREYDGRHWTVIPKEV